MVFVSPLMLSIHTIHIRTSKSCRRLLFMYKSIVNQLNFITSGLVSLHDLSFNILKFFYFLNRISPEMLILDTKPNISSWNLDDGYTETSNPYPLRTVIASSDRNFILKLATSNYEYEYQCRGFYQGYNLILTTPGETLKQSRNSFRVPLSEKTKIAIKPILTITSDGLRNYEPNQRQCFYQHERQLRFFKLYTQSNCEEECLANYTKNECGCVKFSMPSMKLMQRQKSILREKMTFLNLFYCRR